MTTPRGLDAAVEEAFAALLTEPHPIPFLERRAALESAIAARARAPLVEALKEEIAARNAAIMGDSWVRLPKSERDTLVALRLAKHNTRSAREKEATIERVTVDRTTRLDAAIASHRAAGETTR